jgi:hypothetical protein
LVFGRNFMQQNFYLKLTLGQKFWPKIISETDPQI